MGAKWEKALICGLAAAVVGLAPRAFAVETSLWGCGARDANLYRLDKETGAALDTIPLQVAGVDIIGCFGLAFHPATKALFAIVDQDDDGDRALARVDPVSGAVTIVGELQLGTSATDDGGDYYVSLTFDASGVLYTLGGGNCDSCSDDEIYTVDLTTGETTFFTDDFTSSYGPHSIEFDPVSGFLYYVGSSSTEKIDLSNGQGSNVSNDSTVDYAFAFDPEQNLFIGTDRNSLFTMNAAGVVEEIPGSSVGPPSEPRDYAILAVGVVATPTASGVGLGFLALSLASLGVWRMRARRSA